MGDPRTARTALHQAEALHAATVTPPAENTGSPMGDGQLHFYRSHALTTIGETHAAWAAQDDALAAFGLGERLDPALVRLDRALRLAG